MIRPATRALIEEAHRFSAFYRDGFANHLPMALVALDAMGADDARIAAFARAYEGQLEPIAAADTRIHPGDEATFLGRAAHYPAWVEYFDERLTREGSKAVLSAWSAKLSEAIGAAAFHGAIRTAYAVESGVAREFAHALAYWAAAYRAMPTPAEPHGHESPGQVLAAISADPEHAGKRPPGGGISARMGTAAKSASFAAYVGRLDPATLDVDALAAALIRAYAATGDFTLLHGVTGCQAFRVLAPFLPPNATRGLWTAIVAAYMSCGSPAADGWSLQGSDALPWPEIHRLAAECDDEHDVKFAYSCWREWQARGAPPTGTGSNVDDLYRRAASARVCHALAAHEAC